MSIDDEAVHVPVFDEAGHVRRLDDILKTAIDLALSRSTLPLSQLAREMEIGRSTIYRHLQNRQADKASSWVSPKPAS